MKITARIISGWDNALSAARFTVGKSTEIGKQPSDDWKHKMCIAEHSPLREVIFRIECENVPRRAVTHLVRHHNGIEKYVESSRPDRNKNAKEKTTNVAFTINAQALIQISRVRLCKQAWYETRDTWKAVVDAVKEVDNIVPLYCVPNCIYRFGICPEPKCCGFVDSDLWKAEAKEYINLIKKQEK